MSIWASLLLPLSKSKSFLLILIESNIMLWCDSNIFVLNYDFDELLFNYKFVLNQNRGVWIFSFWARAVKPSFPTRKKTEVLDQQRVKVNPPIGLIVQKFYFLMSWWYIFNSLCVRRTIPVIPSCPARVRMEFFVAPLQRVEKYQNQIA